MTEKLDEAIGKYFQNVIKNSWTWQRLTEEEKHRFVKLNIFSEIKGNKDTRERWLSTVYTGFLLLLFLQNRTTMSELLKKYEGDKS